MSIYTALRFSKNNIFGSCQRVCQQNLGLTDDERGEIIDFIASDPVTGDEISGTGGMRKIRFAGQGKGKSGGYRVITFFSGPHIPVFLITIYGKGQKENITAEEKKIMKTLSDALVEIYRSKTK